MGAKGSAPEARNLCLQEASALPRVQVSAQEWLPERVHLWSTQRTTRRPQNGQAHADTLGEGPPDNAGTNAEANEHAECQAACYLPKARLPLIIYYNSQEYS